jgi:hypothetical protein
MKKFTISIILGILVLILIAYLDTGGAIILGNQYTNGNYPSGFWTHFLITSILIMLIIPICYYLFYKKDKSETLAIFLTSFLLFWFGIADIFYFWLQGKSVPLVLNHLNNHPIIGNISEFLGFSSVTPNALYISAIIGIIITYFIVRYLKDKV